MNIPFRTNIGTVANDGTGTPLREAFDWINQNQDYFEKYRRWSPFFTELYQEIAFTHDGTIAITGVNLGTATAIQYSVVAGVWVTYTVPFTITASQSRWRISNMGTGIDANVIIEGLKP